MVSASREDAARSRAAVSQSSPGAPEPSRSDEKPGDASSRLGEAPAARVEQLASSARSSSPERVVPTLHPCARSELVSPPESESFAAAFPRSACAGGWGGRGR